MQSFGHRERKSYLIVAAIVGNAANQVFPTEEYLEEVYEVKNGYTSLFYEKYGTEFPFWDETALFAVLDSSNVLNSTSCKSFRPNLRFNPG